MVAGERYQTKAMSEDFVLDYRGIVVHEDVFDSDSRDLREENSAEGISYRGVDTDEREGREFVGFSCSRLVELDLKGLKNAVRTAVVPRGIYGLMRITFLNSSRSQAWFSPG